MPIIYPESCRGLTSGALRQIKQHGFTNSAGKEGGAFSLTYVKSRMADLSEYKSKREPLGIYMSQLHEARKDIEETTDAVSASARKMIAEASSASASLTDSSRKMRDATEKLNAQMSKFHTIFANTKFDEQAKAAQSLADALERLAKLEEKGLLSKVMAALNK